MKAATIFVVLLLSGCSAIWHPAFGNKTQIYGLYHNPSVLYWEREVARRYPSGAVMVICHGSPDDAIWMCKPDEGGERSVIGLIAEVRARFPTERIVLCICNPNQLTLPASIKNVSYPMNMIWQFPDQVSGLDFDEGFGIDYIGSVFEFVEQ